MSKPVIRWTKELVQQKLDAGTIVAANGLDEPTASGKKKKRAKFNNTKVEWDGMIFDSSKEYYRYRELLLLLKAGEIGQLRRQVTYQLSVCKYIADHVYIDAKTGVEIVEDVKSDVTRKLPTYRLKCKMMLNELGISIKEV